MGPLDGHYYKYDLCWIVKRIKELQDQIITLQNQDTEHTNEIDNLQNQITQLKEYVQNYFANLDVQDEINNKIEDMLESGELASLLQSLNGTVIDVTLLGIANDGTDVSSALNTLFSNNTKLIPYFPDGNYSITNVNCNNIHKMIFSDGAIITGTPFNKIFTWSNVDQIEIEGGQFILGETAQPTAAANTYFVGVFDFDECTNIRISNVLFNYLRCGVGIALKTCQNVLIDNIQATNFVSSAIGFRNGCTNGKVINSIFENGEKINEFMYSYGVATGVANFTDNLPFQMNGLTVENCKFENMSWEGCDCHNGNNVIFRNCYFHNCARFFTCYYDTRPIGAQASYLNMRNILLENLWCENDEDFVVDNTRNIDVTSGYMVYGSTSHHVENVTFKNVHIKNMFANPNAQTVIGIYHEGCINLVYDNVVIDGLLNDVTMDRLVRLVSSTATFKQVTIKNINSQYNLIRSQQGILYAENCVFVPNTDVGWFGSVDSYVYRMTCKNVYTPEQNTPPRFSALLYDYGDEYRAYNGDMGTFVNSYGLREATARTIAGISLGSANADNYSSWIQFDSSSSNNISTRNFLPGQVVSIVSGENTIQTCVTDFIGFQIKVNKYIPNGDCTVSSLALTTADYNWNGYQKET